MKARHLLLCLLSLAAAYLVACRDPEAQFTVDLGVHDFGTLLTGMHPSVQFRHTNLRGQVWEVGDSRSTCGCLLVTPDTTTVPPGSELLVTAAFRALEADFPTVVNQEFYVPLTPGRGMAIGRVKALIVPSPYLAPDACSVVLDATTSTYGFSTTLMVAGRPHVSLPNSAQVALTAVVPVSTPTVPLHDWSPLTLQFEGTLPLDVPLAEYHLGLLVSPSDAPSLSLPLLVVVRRRVALTLAPSYACVAVQVDREAVVRVHLCSDGEPLNFSEPPRLTLTPASLGTVSWNPESQHIDVIIPPCAVRQEPRYLKLDVAPVGGPIATCTLCLVYQ